MLTKAVNLNLKMIKKEIELSIGFFLPAILFGPTSFGALIFFLALAVCVGAQFRGYSRIFGTSVYGDGADIYMTLPLTADIFVLSKVLVGVFWNMAITLVVMVYALVTLLWGSGIQGLTEGLFDALLGGSMDMEISPVQAAITMGLVPLNAVISAALWCLLILSLQNLGMRKCFRKLQSLRASSLTSISMALIFGISQIIALLFHTLAGTVGNVFYLTLGSMVIEGILIVRLYIFCRSSFERGYDLK